MSRKGWLGGFVVGLVLLYLGIFVKPYPNIYEELSISPHASKSEVYGRVLQLSHSGRELGERAQLLYNDVLKEKAYRKAYGRFGDYYHTRGGERGTIDPSFLRVNFLPFLFGLTFRSWRTQRWLCSCLAVCHLH